MNLYIVVEGEQTETKVYPAWLQILVPQLHRIDDAWNLSENSDSYYLFSAGGIPSIYKHVSNAVADINEINACGKGKYDYLLMCIDVEEESRQYIDQKVQEQLKLDGNELSEPTKLVIFEHKICMESWFLGNRKVYKENPQDQDLIKYTHLYNVKENDPELMENLESDSCATKAQFHLRYLRLMFKERNMRYLKSNPDDVCKKGYLDKLVERYQETKHISSFGRWYDFIVSLYH